MFEVSWGELFILTSATIAFIGRKDLPKASYFLGSKVGQIVGLLQGARIRADTFATQNTNVELKALQNELRSGLREIDAVKGELAIAASSRGLVGRGLSSGGVNRQMAGKGGAATISGVNPVLTQPQMMKTNQNTTIGTSQLNTSQTSTSTSTQPILSNKEYIQQMEKAAESNQQNHHSEIMKSIDQLPPRTQSVAAVAEEEWEKQGIGFKSRAELGTGGYWGDQSGGGGLGGGNINNNVHQMSGSSLLSDLVQQSLIHDQYDRAVLEQDEMLRRKVEKSRDKNNENSK